MVKPQAKLSSVKAVWQTFEDKESDLYNRAEAFMQARLSISGLGAKDIGSEPVQFQGFLDVPAFVIPYPGTNHWRVRLDLPEGKYRSPKRPLDGSHSHIRAYFPPGVTRKHYRSANKKYICEGELKAASLYKHLKDNVIAIGGCYMFSRPGASGNVLIDDIQEMLKPRDEVYYIADRDIVDPTKPGIAQAATSLKVMVERAGCTCTILVPSEEYKGIDEWLADGHDVLAELEEFDIGALFSSDYLLSQGVQFKAAKDGSKPLSNALLDDNNSMIVANLVLNGGDVISYDKYTGLQFRGDDMPFNKAAQMLRVEINKLMPGLRLKEEIVQTTLETHAMKMSKLGNKVSDYIRALEWDKISRLESWLPQVMDIGRKTPDGVAAKAGFMLICALLARVMEPGCQQDYMFVLVGPQGIGKTTFFRTLGDFPVHKGYAITNNIELSKEVSTTFALKLRSAVVLDCDDVESLGRGAQGHLKQFLSRPFDTWRELYSSLRIDELRGFIVVGSSNTPTLLSDPTGARRFIVLDVTDIRGKQGPYRWSPSVRDQLLAEAWYKWDTLKDTWWQAMSVKDIQDSTSQFRWQDSISAAITEMLENDKIASYGKHGKVLSASAISTWIDSPNRESTPDAVSRKLAALIGSPVCPFIIDNKVMVYTAKLLEGMSDDMRRLYIPKNKVEKLWVYPIKPRT
jgi:hypothetical protein